MSDMYIFLHLIDMRSIDQQELNTESLSNTEFDMLNNDKLTSGVVSEIIPNISDLVTSFAYEQDTEEVPAQTYTGWATTNINIRTEPNTDSYIVGVIPFNAHVTYTYYNESWYVTEDGYYISAMFLAENECPYTIYNVPTNTGFKSYMSHKSITTKSSSQYVLQLSYAYTGNYGIRQINGRYLVAIGTAFNASVGTYFDLILENGEVVQCIVGDVKADKDTKSDNITTAHNGCVSEFIVDTSIFTSLNTGDVSSVTTDWDSPVAQIKVYEKNCME